MPSRLYFIAVPLLLVFIPALLSIIRRSDDMNRWHKFLVVVLVASMVLASLGLGTSIVVNGAFGNIPGTASAGGRRGDYYYFYYRKHHLETPVDKETWEWAFIDEQIGAHLTYIPIVTFALALLTLYLTRRWFRTDPIPEPTRFRPPLKRRFRLKVPITPVLCVMNVFVVADFILVTVLTDLGISPSAAHMLILVAGIFVGGGATMATQRPQGIIFAIPGGLMTAFLTLQTIESLVPGSPSFVNGSLVLTNVGLALLFVALLFAASYVLVSKWTELPNKWR